MDTNELVKEAMYSSIAKTILEGVDTTARDAIIQRSIESALKDYQFKQAVEKVAAKRAEEIAEELLKGPEWTALIQEAIRRGFNNYLINLERAVSGSLIEMLHGVASTDTYKSRGAYLLAKWPTNEEE